MPPAPSTNVWISAAMKTKVMINLVTVNTHDPQLKFFH